MSAFAFNVGLMRTHAHFGARWKRCGLILLCLTGCGISSLFAQTTDGSIPKTVTTSGTEASPVLYIIGNTPNYVRDFGQFSNFNFGYSVSGVSNYNQLTVQNGGDVLAASFTIGNGLSGTHAADHNSVLVTGVGSTWTATSSGITVGSRADSNSLTFASGATGSATTLTVGSFIGSDHNSVTVTGTGSTLTLSTAVRINLNASGTNNIITVANGGTLQTPSLSITDGANNTFNLNDGGTFHVTSDFDAALSGFNFANGGTLTVGGGLTNLGTVGATSDDTGRTIQLSGSSASYDFGADATFGTVGGSNTFSVLAGADVTGSGTFTLGNSASNTALILDGSGSTWTQTGGANFVIGQTGTGNNATIRNGASMSNGFTALGLFGGSDANTLTVTGSGSTLTTVGFGVGVNGTNSTLSVLDGATLDVNGGENYIGFHSVGSSGVNSNNNTVRVSGSGSTLDANGQVLHVGYHGQNNSLLVEAGGSVTTATTNVGFQDAATGNSASVTGASASWTNSGTLTIGNANNSGNTVTVGSGGALTTGSLTLGSGTGNTMVLNTGGTLTVSSNVTAAASQFNFNGGALVLDGATWSTTGDLGAASITLQDNAQLTVGALDATNLTFTSGTLSVSGALTNYSSAASQTLNVNSGGSWQAGNNPTIGGTVNLNTGGSLQVGAFDAGQGGFNFNGGTIAATGAITNLGTITSGYAVDLSGGGSFGGSTTLNGGSLTVGDFNFVSSNLTFTAGTLNAAGALTNYNSASGQTLNLQAGGTWTPTNGAFGGTVNVDGGTLTATGALSGNLSINSGMLDLSGGGSLSGSMGYFTGGELKVGAFDLSSVTNHFSAFPLAGTVRGVGALTGSLNPALALIVDNGGSLSGTGTVGTLTVASGGLLSPGNSPGTLSAGDTIWEGDSSMLWEIDDATGTQGSDWDLLAITGTLTINATAANPFTLNIDTLLNGTSTAGAMANFDAGISQSWIFVTTTSGISYGPGASVGSSFALDTSGFANSTNGSFAVIHDGNNLALAYTTAVPEPAATAALFGTLALVGSSLTRRRRR